MFAEIIIPLALPQNYTWKVPEQFQDAVLVGCRVEVNLGPKKKYAGIIKRLHQEKPQHFEPKDILNIIDSEPVIHERQLQLWQWIAEYYCCSEGEVMAAAVPAHFKLSSESILVVNEEYGDDFSALDNDEYVIAEALFIKKELKLTEVQQLLDVPHVYPVINRLIQKRVCFVWESLKQTYNPKKETFVVLHPNYHAEENLAKLLNEDSKLQRAEKQLELLLAYLHYARTEGDVSKTLLLKKAGASDAQLKGLVDKGILQTEKRVVDRVAFLPKDIQIDFTLSEGQQKALEQIQTSFLDKPVCLLHGVTSSGKTLLYIRLIEELIRQGKQVLYMLPEIALTAQIIRRLQKHFGGHIGIYHSKFSQNERVEIWNKVKSGELKVVLGARSSIFLPWTNLGLIICDEEHDSSYKQQDPAPRYHARDAAVYYASLFNAKVLLGSATPSIETYHNAIREKYGLVIMTQRYGEYALPAIEIIDTKRMRRPDPADRGKVTISEPMKMSIAETIARDKQVILFQNRRGYSPFQICAVCGWIPQCKNCDVSLTFHKLSNKLQCHYCGTTYPPLHTCAACGSHQFLRKNFGTERIEEQLQEEFPDNKVGRMDVDTVRGKNAHDILIQQFEQGRIDILVGTQMVVKGLDFDRVEMVGILDADGLLHFADFRVNERAYQLMEQVSGRAGRKGHGGKVLIQTSNPNHPVLQLLPLHDFRTLYDFEIPNRKRFDYPPFTRVIVLTFRHKLKETVQAASVRLADYLSTDYKNYLVGPAEPIIPRIRNQYRMELLLKLPRDQGIIAKCKRAIADSIAILHQEKKFASVVVVIDVDPQ